MAGLYLHIPFCKRICAYCDFYKSAVLRHMEPSLEAMRREMAARRDYLGGEPLKTIYFGGGTPSLLTTDQIAGLLRCATENFDCSHVGETTLEANPDDLTPQYLDALRRMGINRLSIGIQSLDDGCLKLMNRRHSAAQAIKAVSDARAAGFENITLDLIFGVPGFGGESLDRTIEGILNLAPEHISAYHLTIEPQTAFGRRMARGEFFPIEETESEAEFSRVHDTLSAAGYDHYEVSNFARPGFRSHHNSAYWQGVKYLGIGAAAHSFNGTERHWNVADVERYIAGEQAECEHLSDRDRFNEYLMTRLRTAEGVDFGYIGREFGLRRLERMKNTASRWIASGMLRQTDTGLAVPSRRFLISDAVIEALFEDGSDDPTE